MISNKGMVGTVRTLASTKRVLVKVQRSVKMYGQIAAEKHGLLGFVSKPALNRPWLASSDGMKLQMWGGLQ